jgi:hypothetical protein
MTFTELVESVRRVEIRTNHLVNDMMVGTGHRGRFRMNKPV